MKLIDNRRNTDAAVHLALEEFCLTHLNPEEDYLLFYINRPSIIIGAHQNPWEEIDPHVIHRKKIPVYRRKSGGGTVYHDFGNLNVAYITRHHREAVGRFETYMRPIRETLSHLVMPAVSTHGNSIFVKQKKISGFAQFGNLRRTLTHGTLLFDSDLRALKQTLTPTLEIVETKAIASVRKEVNNLKPLLKTPISMDDLIQLFIQEIASGINNVDRIRLSSTAWRQVHSLAKEKYGSWEWNFGRSPFFSVRETVKKNGANRSLLLEINRGLVTAVDCQKPHTADLFDEYFSREPHKRLIGKKYYPGITGELITY